MRNLLHVGIIAGSLGLAILAGISLSGQPSDAQDCRAVDGWVRVMHDGKPAMYCTTSAGVLTR